MQVKSLKITNNSGDSITFGRHFFLDDGWDLSGLAAVVNYSDSNKDGASYQSTRMDVRDFPLPFFIKNNVQNAEWIETRRQEAYTVFNPKKNPHTLEFETLAGQSYLLNAELTASPIFATEESIDESNEFWQDGLLQFTCSDPYLYKKDNTVVHIAAWIPNIVWPLVIPEEGEGVAFAYRTPSLIANVLNEGQVDSGIIIKFRATGPVSRPSLINVNTYQELKMKMDLETGDVVEISTERGKRYAKLIKNNVPVSVFGKIEPMSDFLVVEPGDNLFRYDAAVGIDNLEVTIYISNKYLGV